MEDPKSFRAESEVSETKNGLILPPKSVNCLKVRKCGLCKAALFLVASSIGTVSRAPCCKRVDLTPRSEDALLSSTMQ